MIHKAYIVPGQPHPLLAPDKNAGWASLRRSYEAVGREIAKSGAELLLVYSTQWFSVIGHLFQTHPKPAWTLVDANWYEYGSIPYEFRIDPEFGKLYCGIAKSRGMQAATVAYHGFPIDTGTVVALKLLNPDNAIPASIVSCNIYAEREETRALGFAGRAAIDAYGKKTVVVCVTNFSNRYEVADIDPAKDRISSQKDDEWNRKLLEMFGEGRLEDVAQVARDFAREANADMGFKAIWWLGAVMGEHNKYDGKVWDYQPVWGTGNAIVELTPNERKQMDWEKEFDEGPVGDFKQDERGTGLETHNVLAEGPEVHRQSEMSSHSETPNVIRTERAPSPVGPYPHARRVGDFLFLSGIGQRARRRGERDLARHRGPDARLHRKREDHSRGGRQLAGESHRRAGLPDRHAARLRPLQSGVRGVFRKNSADAHHGGRRLAADADCGGIEGGGFGLTVILSRAYGEESRPRRPNPRAAVVAFRDPSLRSG